MKLISSETTVTFLSAAAPRPWVKRTLSWMILDDQLRAYFRRGVIRPYCQAANFLFEFMEEAGGLRGPKMDELVSQKFEPNFAAQLVGKEVWDRVYDEPISWGEGDEPHAVSAGFFLFANEVDWEQGTLRSDYVPDEHDGPDWLFWDREEHLGSNFDRADFQVEMSGLCFEKGAVELLLPTAQLHDDPNGPIHTKPTNGRGRPRKWDWEGAMAHVVSLAQHPDGLPQGYGAQAYIERAMAEWFTSAFGDSPSTGQIRERVQPIMRALESAGKTFQTKQTKQAAIQLRSC